MDGQAISDGEARTGFAYPKYPWTHGEVFRDKLGSHVHSGGGRRRIPQTARGSGRSSGRWS